MTFDYVSQFESEDAVLDYGCLYGNEKIVFIKVGLGGNYLGDESRYLKIARRLHEAHGCSVISVSNPYVENRRIDVEKDRSILRDFMQKQNFQNPELYFFGHSNGCVKGLELAASGVTFHRMILTNMPLMINFHKIKKWLAAISQTNIIAVYGERDPSYPYVPLLDGRTAGLETRIIPETDHNFAGKLDVFMTLADSLIGDVLTR